jgi:hypothetical protein
VTLQIGWHQHADVPIDDSARSRIRVRVAAARADCPVMWQALLWYSASRWLPFAGQHGGVGWAWFWPWPLVPGRWVLLAAASVVRACRVSVESKRTPNRCMSGRICSIPPGCLDALLAVGEHEGEAQGHRRPRFGLLDVRGF